jgi:hypothetical protein
LVPVGFRLVPPRMNPERFSFIFNNFLGSSHQIQVFGGLLARVSAERLRRADTRVLRYVYAVVKEQGRRGGDPLREGRAAAGIEKGLVWWRQTSPYTFIIPCCQGVLACSWDKWFGLRELGNVNGRRFVVSPHGPGIGAQTNDDLAVICCLDVGCIFLRPLQ